MQRSKVNKTIVENQLAACFRGKDLSNLPEVRSVCRLIHLNTIADAYCCTFSEDEIATKFKEFIRPLSYHHHIAVCVFMGRGVRVDSVNAMQNILSDTAKNLFVPLNRADNTIYAYVSFLREWDIPREQEVDDSATHLLHYDTYDQTAARGRHRKHNFSLFEE